MVSMQLDYWPNDRGGWTRIVLLALALLAICVGILAFLSEHSDEPFGLDNLYGYLD